jgi:hypothetical protein
MVVMNRLGIALLLCALAVGCEKAPVNPYVPKFLKHPNGKVYVHAQDGCDYNLQDNGTLVKDETSCPK